MSNIKLLFRSVFTTLTLCIATCTCKAQTPGKDMSLLLSVTLQPNAPAIVLSWQPVPGALDFTIYRKAKTATSWGTPLVTGLPGTATSWTDTNVQTGVGYEYKVVDLWNGTPEGYIYTGINLPPVLYRGKVLCIYDTISTAGLSSELLRWKNDVVGDGWAVKWIKVNQNDSPISVKAKIVSEYNQDPVNTKAAFVFGRVPVPYSGETNPDGHPNHIGAWPADPYYAELTGVWTDTFVNNVSAAQSRNHNIPGDGKFDENVIPGNVELQLGRVDMRKLPAFAFTETQLLKKYLDKNHAYRNKAFTTINRALIDDNFTTYVSGFSASGWRSFSSLCNATNIATTDYFTSMQTGKYQWSYGCGSGNYTSAAGIGSSIDMANDSLQSIFTMLFGSYFGDWDSNSNNFLRAALANGSTLANCWSGYPKWYFHHMGMGEHIGFSTKASMDNFGTYEGGMYQGGVHMALMGDPTLRAHIVAPAKNLIVTNVNSQAVLNWTASADTILGYHIFRMNDSTQQFEQITINPVAATSFTDPCLVYPGIYTYMVRALKLENTNSGTYYNMSTGVMDTLINLNYSPVIAACSYTAIGAQVTFSNNSQNAATYYWNFDDGNNSTQSNPVHTYTTASVFTVTLIASSPCGSDTMIFTVHIPSLTGMDELDPYTYVLYPNPTHGIIHLKANVTFEKLEVINMLGQIVSVHKNTNTIDLSEQTNGIYFLKGYNNNRSHIYKVQLVK